MIPIAKNILVVDEEGNEYEATWPKRARGLVKNGRARFLSEHKICLACPPWIEMEDNEMTDIIMTNTQIEEGAIAAFRAAASEMNGSGDSASKVADSQGNVGSASERVGGQANGMPEDGGTKDMCSSISNTSGSGIDMAYIFSQIEAIQGQTKYLYDAIDALSQMADGDSGDCGAPGNLLGEAKAEAIGDVVRCRETTNQQLLNFYMTVYNDLKSQA